MRKFMFAMGVMFSALIGVFIGSLSYIGVQAANTADDNKKMAVELIEDLSSTWQAAGRRDIFTTAALTQIETANGRQAIRVMSRLGQLVEARDLEQTGYKVAYGEGATATIRFSGVFENGTSDVDLTLKVKGRKSRIVELDLTKIKVRASIKRRSTA